jgi:hypothetical protein
MNKYNFIQILFSMLLISYSCKKPEATIYDKQKIACQECFDNNPLTNSGDSTDWSFSGEVNGISVCYSVKKSGYDQSCVTSSMGYSPVINGGASYNSADAFAQSATIWMVSVDNVGKAIIEGDPIINLTLPFLSYNKDSVKTLGFILDKWLNEKKLKFSTNRDGRVIREGFEFSMTRFCSNAPYGFRDYQPSWTLTSLNEKQSNKAYLKLTNILKEEHVLSYEYTLRFEIECKLFKNNEFIGWLRDGVYKTNFHVYK